MSESKTEAAHAAPKRRPSGARVPTRTSPQISADTNAQPMVDLRADGAPRSPGVGVPGVGDSAGGPLPEARVGTPVEDGSPADASTGASASEISPTSPDVAVVDQNAAIQVSGNPNLEPKSVDAAGTGSTADGQAGSHSVEEPTPPRKIRGLRPGETEEDRRIRLIKAAVDVAKKRKRRLKQFLSAKATAEVDNALLKLKTRMNKLSASHPYRPFDVLASIADKAWESKITPDELLVAIDQMKKK